MKTWISRTVVILGTVSLLDKMSPSLVHVSSSLAPCFSSGPGCHLGSRLRLWCFTSTQTIRLIRDGWGKRKEVFFIYI